HRRNQAALLEVPQETPAVLPDRILSRSIVAQCLARGGGWLDAPDATRLLSAYGIPVVACHAAPDARAAAAIARDLGYPVVLKILSPDITHKSDVGGVAAGLASDEAVESAASA